MTAPTATNLRALLSDCASEAPASFRDQRQSQGFSRARQIIADASAAGVAIEPVLADLLRTGDADEVWLALVFLPLDAAVRAGLASVDVSGFYEDVQEVVRSKLGIAVARGLSPYTAAFRTQRYLPSGESLLAAILAYDHAWAMANPQLALGSTLDKAKFDLGFATRELSLDEGRTLRDEFAKNAVGLPSDWATELGATLDRYLAATGQFSSFVRGVRFTPIL